MKTSSSAAATGRPSRSKPASRNLPVLTAKVSTLHFKAPVEPGWRNPTITDKIIMRAIEAAPGLNAREYADKTLTYTSQVNDFLYYTREGRTLAEQRYITLPFGGRLPRWAAASLQVFKRRQRVNHLSLVLPKAIVGENRTLLRGLASMVAQISLHSSPRKLRDLHDGINEALTTCGLARVDDQALLAASNGKMLAISQAVQSYQPAA